MVYEWKSGSRIKADAQKSGELFEQLSASENGLTAETLLEANKPKSAPLHDEYEWNDKKAAHEWRLFQSRHFINSIVTVQVQEDESKPAEPIRAFFVTTEKSKYEPLHAIVKEQSKYEKLLDTALSELIAFKRKYEYLKELQPVFDAMKEVKT